MSVKKGQVYELEIQSAAYEGVSVARRDNFVFFVSYAVPGDRVRARVVRKKKKFAEAVVEELLDPSPHRVKPTCPYFGTCGGCTWQNVDYLQQLEFKQEQVRSIMERVGGLDSPPVKSTLASDSYYYRNKMEFTFGTNRWLLREEIESGKELPKGFALGLHIPRRYDKILDLDVCFLQSSISAEIVNRVRQIALENEWSAYNTHRHQGYLRNLVIREGKNTGQMMVNLVTIENRPERLKILVPSLTEEFPAITTVINSINSSRSPVAAGEEVLIYHGNGKILEKIGPLHFEITATSFFQPNTLMAEKLFEVILNYAALTGNETVFDLYSGVGAIALTLAPSAQRVIAIENHQESVEGARRNAESNGLDNCLFYAADVQEMFQQSTERHGLPDVLVLDPPRAGLHPALIEEILSVKPRRIVYSSCNPATQARDLKALSDEYHLESMQPIDMFPQTYHIENVAALRLRAS